MIGDNGRVTRLLHIGTSAIALVAFWSFVTPVAAADRACPAPEERQRLIEEQRSATPYATAERLWTRSTALARACGDGEWEVEAYSVLSRQAAREGDVDAVVVLERQRYALARQHGLQRHAAESRASLGKALMAKGEFRAARIHLQAARVDYQRQGESAAEASVLSELSRLDRRQGGYLSALQNEMSALELRRTSQPNADLTRSLLSLASLYEQIEMPDEARTHYSAALTEAERRGDSALVADALNGFAGFLNDFGRKDADLALTMAQRSFEITRDSADQARLGSRLLQIGRARFNLGDLDAAESAFREADAVASASSSTALKAHIEYRWGELDLARGHLDAALARFERARAEYDREGNRHRLIKVYGTLEQLHILRGDALAAARAGREHYRMRNELLGASETGKLGDLLNNFGLREERYRNERLQQENTLAAVNLKSQRATRFAGFALAGLVLFALALLLWRHRSVTKLNRMLHDRNEHVLGQGRALADANERLQQQSDRLYQSSITDFLTGIHARAHGIDSLRSMLANHRECGTSPTLLLIDIDHFKSVNDTYGHPVGDSVLTRVAQTLRDVAPGEAVVARLGGEEFMVAIEEGSDERGLLLADALRRRVRELRVDTGSRTVGVTISIGVCSVESTAGGSIGEMLAGADAALYGAKHAGRDCIREFHRAAA